MFRSTSLRLAALYTAGFALAVVLLGAATLAATRQALTSQFDGRIHAEAMALRQEARRDGLPSMIRVVRVRDRTPGALEYGLQDAKGHAIEGRLALAQAPVGWSDIRVPEAEGEPPDEPDRIRVYTVLLPGGARLMVGDDLEPVEKLHAVILQRFGWAFLGVVLLGIAGGYLLSRDVHRRLGAISATAEGIIDGDLSRRIPERGSDDDLDRLAQTLNRMLDRIGALMDSLRQVSNDIAHDLRTPLTRLRQRLEAIVVQTEDAERREELEGAIDDMDATLATFEALLRIAQVEGGARRAGFRPVDLAEIARTVAEAFAPSAQEAGGSLRVAADEPAPIEGDRELLTQMIANLIENSLRHAPGSQVAVRVMSEQGHPVLSVADDGPGAPEAELSKLSDRFYRLERSRSTPGSGLGLALVAAIAKLHGARLNLASGEPGFEARAVFEGAPSEDGERPRRQS